MPTSSGLRTAAYQKTTNTTISPLIKPTFPSTENGSSNGHRTSPLSPTCNTATIGYDLEGFQDNPTLFINKHYDFFNPKAGVTYTGHEWQAYLSYSRASHEPNRDDFEAGMDQQPKPETLNDFELGFEKKNLRNSFGATVFYMQYKDQLALTGKINDVGAYTRTNIPNSYRLGIELQGSSKVTDWFAISGNLALSRNKVKNYTEYIDDYDNGGQKTYFHPHPDIAFSPAIVGGAILQFFPFPHYEISLPAKYVSKAIHGQYPERIPHARRLLCAGPAHDLYPEIPFDPADRPRFPA